MKFRELNVGDWFVANGMMWEKVEYPKWADASIMCLDKNDYMGYCNYLDYSGYSFHH